MMTQYGVHEEYQPRSPKNLLQQVAVEMVKTFGLDVRLGEQRFVSRATPLIEDVVKEAYEKARMTPPARKTISNWLYLENPPELAMVLIVNCWESKKSQLNLHT